MAAIGMFSGYCGTPDDADGGKLQHQPAALLEPPDKMR